MWQSCMQHEPGDCILYAGMVPERTSMSSGVRTQVGDGELFGTSMDTYKYSHCRR